MNKLIQNDFFYQILSNNYSAAIVHHIIKYLPISFHYSPSPFITQEKYLEMRGCRYILAALLVSIRFVVCVKLCASRSATLTFSTQI